MIVYPTPSFQRRGHIFFEFSCFSCNPYIVGKQWRSRSESGEGLHCISFHRHLLGPGTKFGLTMVLCRFVKLSYFESPGSKVKE